MMNNSKPQLDTDFETTDEKTWRPEIAVNVSESSAVLFSPSQRDRVVTGIDCRRIFQGDRGETQKARMIMARSARYLIPDADFIELTKNCSEFVTNRGYITEPISEVEANFPIAFSILMYKEAEQAERFLRSIYHPQNIYCIHVDRDSPKVLHWAMKNIASCLPNVFIASKLESVIYGGFSRLQADINCMTDLLKKNIRWKYFMNQPSQAFPLRTNAEMVNILKIYNGSNDLEGKRIKKDILVRFFYKYKLHYPRKAKKPIIVHSIQRKGKPPHGLHITKGSAYGIFSRDFVQFILNDKVAQEFLNWLRDTYSPDEQFWSTLHHTKSDSFLKTPGGYAGGKPDILSFSKPRDDMPVVA
jgi:hypothetical protein